MLRRLFWLAMGVTIGALVVQKMSRAVDRLSPGSLGQSLINGLNDLSDTLRDFAGDVRSSMAERESALREGVGLDGTLGRPPRPEPGTPPAQ